MGRHAPKFTAIEKASVSDNDLLCVGSASAQKQGRLEQAMGLSERHAALSEEPVTSLSASPLAVFTWAYVQSKACSFLA